MKRNKEKIFLIICMFVYLFNAILVTNNSQVSYKTYAKDYLLGNNTNLSDNQIVDIGGEVTDKWTTDGVKISKTIDGTDKEDYFDITLQVKTKKDVKSIMETDSAAVVFVLDLSETMNAAVDGGDITKTNPKKITSTLTQVKEFVKTYKSDSVDYPNNQVGVVGFNSNGKDLVGLQLVKNLNLSTFNTSLTNAVNNVVNAPGYAHATDKYTNMHAGLKKAQTMLNSSNAKYKYVVFLSDGMPTTYSKSGYTGIDTTTLTDQINGNRALVGGNYSDTGAQEARKVAMNLKSKGVKIYSVGVGLKTFDPWTNENYTWVPYMCKTFNKDGVCTKYYSNLNGEQFLVEQMARGSAVVSTVENKLGNVTSGKLGSDIWSNNESKILNKPWEFAKDYSKFSNYVWNDSMSTPNATPLSTDYSVSNRRNLFADWLKYGIGSGKYFTIDSASGFDGLAADITSYLQDDLLNKRTDLWKTVDPMPAYSTTTDEYIEFKGFLNSSNTLVQSLSGSHTKNGNNTASFTKTNSTGVINWDLKKSGYTTITEDNITVYVYTLKYRVRLRVEAPGFVHGKTYNTNGTTTLTYVSIENGVASKVKKLNYKIPKVKGFLEQLKIKKTVEGLAEGLNFTDDKFSFIIKFKDSNNQPINSENKFFYDKYDSSGLISSNNKFKSGDSIILRDGDYVIIHNLYHDITYTVTETPKNGFVSTVTSGKATDTTVSDPKKIKEYEVNYNNKTYQLKLKKVDADDNSKILEGVKFTLYQTYENNVFSNPVTSMNGRLLKDLITNDKGTIDFGNLSFTSGGNSVYYLVEEDTIDRYCLLDTYIKITVNSNGISATYDGEDSIINTSTNGSLVELTVPNKIGIDLPQTGAEGSLIYTFMGITLVLFSGILYKKKIKKNN